MQGGNGGADQKATGIPIAPYPPSIGKNTRFASSAQVSSFSSSIASSMNQPSSVALSRQQSTLSDAAGTEATPEPLNSSSSLATPQLQFFQPDVLACINCSTEVTEARPLSTGTSDTTPRTSTSPKVGPLLMELRRIVQSDDGYDDDDNGERHFFRTKSLFQARGNPNFGMSVASTCLSIHSERRVCATGLSSGSLCLHSSTLTEGSATPEYYQNGQRMNHRAASAVAWRPDHSSHIAVGLTVGNSAGERIQPMRLAGGRSTHSTSDRDYHCFIWDIEHQRAGRAKTTPLHRFAHQTGVASLAWVLEGQVLALGNQHRNIQLHDLRMDTGVSRAPLTVYAHNFGVNGIERDPSKPFQFISYSRVMGEPVKLWDARRMTVSPVTEVKMGPSAIVRTAKWAQDGQLTILHTGALHCYDTSSGTRPVFSQSFHVGDTVRDFATYQHYNRADTTPFTNYIRKRVFVTRNDKSITDVPFHRSAPLSFSKCTGEIINAFASDIHFQTVDSGPDEDISSTMMRRAKGTGKVRYSVNVEANIRFLIDEAEKVVNENDEQRQLRNELYNVWRWIDWIEEILEKTSIDKEKLLESTLQFKGLHDAGVLTLLELDKNGQDLQGMSKTLAVATFDSKGRRAALSSCGWPGNLKLSVVMKGREADGEYERSAALAVWYGDIGSAVDVLKRGMKAYAERGDAQYAETVELIMISIAGFRSGNDVGAEVWRKTCGALLNRIDQERTRSSKTQGVDYLQHILRFLMGVGDENAHKGMLRDTKLSLCDRVAFACRFLPQAELRHYLEFCISECRETGNLEGLTITGINKDGIEIIQSFVDRTADVQSAALLTSRVIYPNDSFERKIAWEWLNEYRSLLNRLQMWQIRAKFDVERADMLRNLKHRMEGYNAPKRRVPLNRRGTFRGVDPDIQAPIPAQLDARCNFCSASLGLRRADSHAWQSNMKNVLSCCPSCRKPLPRCAICLLSLGTLNPYNELAKRGTESNNHANLPFAEWFTWCVRCRHGGHAHHLVSWFSKHDTCPISGCDCQCKFDSHQSQKERNVAPVDATPGSNPHSPSASTEKSI